MSDKTTWEQLKEIKGLLASIIAFAAGCLVLGGFLMEWRIDVNVTAALSKQDLATDTKIVAMDTATAENT